MSSFSDAPVKSIPLHRDPSLGAMTFPGGPSIPAEGNLFAVTLEQERDMSSYGANAVIENFPTTLDEFVRIVSPFNGSSADRVQSIGHTKNPYTLETNWYAIVRPGTGSDQILTSVN